jgi:hypothetical protein
MISVFTCCDVRYHFRIKMMLGSSLPPVIGGLASYLRYVCLFAYRGVLQVLYPPSSQCFDTGLVYQLYLLLIYVDTKL